MSDDLRRRYSVRSELSTPTADLTRVRLVSLAVNATPVLLHRRNGVADVAAVTNTPVEESSPQSSPVSPFVLEHPRHRVRRPDMVIGGHACQWRGQSDGHSVRIWFRVSQERWPWSVALPGWSKSP